MKQLHLALPPTPGATLPVPPDVRQRLERVLRLRPGAPLLLADGAGRRLPVRWQVTTFEAVGPLELAPPPARPVTLAIGLLKGERWDWLLEKATELGVDVIAPLELDHCVARADARKHARWQAVVAEAFEQCGRPHLPAVLPPQPLPRWLAGLGTASVWWADERQPPPAVAQGLTTAPSAIAVVVGPEGGLSAAERALLATRGAPISLAPHVLRAETAGMVAVTLAIARRDGALLPFGVAGAA
jgi:16S rRNA (uracil1498-N3)-methyltransferase